MKELLLCVLDVSIDYRDRPVLKTALYIRFVISCERDSLVYLFFFVQSDYIHQF